MIMQHSLKPFARASLLLSFFLTLTGCANYQRIAEEKTTLETKNLQLATQYLKVNQPLKAITRLDKALALNPNSSQAYGLLGIIYQRQGEYPLAEKNFTAALRLSPNDSNIRNNYGTLLYSTQRYKEAAKEFHRVTKDVYYENRDRVFSNLGTTYFRMGNLEEAIGYYQRALRLNAHLYEVNLKLAEVFFRQKKLQQAYSHYSNFTEMSRQSAESLWFGIRLAYQMNQPKKATQYGQKLSQLYAHSLEYRQYQTLLTNESRDQKHQR